MQALEMKMGCFIRFAKQTLFVYGLWFEEGERRERGRRGWGGNKN